MLSFSSTLTETTPQRYCKFIRYHSGQAAVRHSQSRTTHPLPLVPIPPRLCSRVPQLPSLCRRRAGSPPPPPHRSAASRARARTDRCRRSRGGPRSRRREETKPGRSAMRVGRAAAAAMEGGGRSQVALQERHCTTPCVNS